MRGCHHPRSVLRCCHALVGLSSSHPGSDERNLDYCTSCRACPIPAFGLDILAPQSHGTLGHLSPALPRAQAEWEKFTQSSPEEFPSCSSHLSTDPLCNHSDPAFRSSKTTFRPLKGLKKRDQRELCLSAAGLASHSTDLHRSWGL